MPQGMKCPFQLLLTDFVFFYVKFTVFRRGHTGFATIGTFVIIFTNVTIMALLRTLETNDCFLCIGFVHVHISDIWSNVQGFEHMGLPWRYNGQCEWRLEYWACYMLLERCLNHWWAFQSLFWLSKLPSNHSATLTTPLYAIISIFDSWYQQFALKKQYTRHDTSISDLT